VSDVTTRELLFTRAAVRQALTQTSEALRRVRSAKIRSLVDDEGISIGQVAELLGHPRQLVKRLYDADRKNKPADGSSDEGDQTGDEDEQTGE
jgi:hypothetical protein